ncbi:MAG: hypothetical protein AMXMBFR47_24770 [Planctomycetota bacterium]
MKRRQSTYNLSFRSVLSAVARHLCTRLAAAADRSSRGILMPLLTLGFLLSALSGVSRAEQFWVAWEGNDYPENEGWERSHYVNGPPAIRTLADGIMTLDGMESVEVTDMYRMYRPLNPGPGEEFVAQWRLRVNVIGNPNFPYDPGVAIYGDNYEHVLLVFGVNEFYSILERRFTSFDKDMFHTWELRSSNMGTFSLALDNTVVYAGAFAQAVAVGGRISWGDLVYGSNSVSEWDYFRFGVIPEPSSSVTILLLLLAAGGARRFRCSGYSTSSRVWSSEFRSAQRTSSSGPVPGRRVRTTS